MYLDARSREAFFTADVRDTHGLPVYVEVWDSHKFLASFCGKTSKAIEFHPGDSLRFHVGLPLWGVQTKCPQHSVKTTGTIRVTLSNRP
jgi:hypothetical protein